MKCIVSFCAEGIIKDWKSNNISVFNIFEEFNMPGFPFVIPRIFFFSLLEKKEGEIIPEELDLIVKNNDLIVLNEKVPVHFRDSLRNREILEIGGLTVPGPGSLVFSLLNGKTKICSYSINVKKSTPTRVKSKTAE